MLRKSSFSFLFFIFAMIASIFIFNVVNFVASFQTSSSYSCFKKTTTPIHHLSFTMNASSRNNNDNDQFQSLFFFDLSYDTTSKKSNAAISASRRENSLSPITTPVDQHVLLLTPMLVIKFVLIILFKSVSDLVMYPLLFAQNAIINHHEKDHSINSQQGHDEYDASFFFTNYNKKKILQPKTLSLKDDNDWILPRLLQTLYVHKK